MGKRGPHITGMIGPPDDGELGEAGKIVLE